MNPIAKLLSPEDICLEVDVATKAQLLEEIGRHMARRHGLRQEWVVQSLARREQVGSTGMGEGVAIPHARVRDLDRIAAAYLRLRNPLPFDSPDDRPVIHVVVLLVPKQADEEHLRVLAAVSRLFSDRQFRTQLEGCVAPGQVSALVGTWPAAG